MHHSCVSLVVLLLSILLTGSHSQTPADVEAHIRTLQGSKPRVLDQTALDKSGTYQRKALNAAKTYLSRKGSTRKNIREYYVLACIFYATNGVANKFTEAEGMQVVPQWTKRDNWILTTDYCQWYGVACFSYVVPPEKQLQQEANKLVLEINISSNNVYGEFPSEIALIGSHFLALDIAKNGMHTCSSYTWMQSMTQMEALFFDETSWEANPIPLDLRFMVKLLELDISDTYWRGVLTENAFNNLKQIRYMDLSDNYFDYTNMITIPDYISGLPDLSHFYLENIQPTANSPRHRNRLSLDFVRRMPNIFELSMDFTAVRGPLPSDFGAAKKLTSFSCTYCKLTGTLPAAITQTSMKRMWLSGNNNLRGTIPASISLLDWRVLYLEGTGLTGKIPQALCDQVGPNKLKDLTELGGSRAICPDNCCTCYDFSCGLLQAPTAAPGGGSLCFSGDSEVEVKNEGLVTMNDLSVGDLVKVAGDKFEAVYSFGHYSPNTFADFLQIYTEGGRIVEVSRDHMVLVERNYIPASLVKQGDLLVTASGKHVAVMDVRGVRRQGVFAPFTQSGTIVVNDIVASNYIAYQNSKCLVIFGIESPFTFQWLAHTFKSIHRLAYRLGFAGEVHTDSGVSRWVDGPHWIGSWLLEQNGVVILAVLLPLVVVLGMTTAFDSLLNYPSEIMVSVLICFLTLVAVRRKFGIRLSGTKM